MDDGVIFLLLLLGLGILASSRIIACAAGLLLLIKVLKFSFIFKLLEKTSLELGLFFLVISVLVPLISEGVSFKELYQYCYNWKGIAAFLGGLIATRVNFMGLDLLEKSPYLIITMIIGVIAGISLGGIPVGPLMAGGISALIIFLVEKLV